MKMKEEISLLKYSNTNTYLIEGERGAILFDTGWAGTLSSFCHAMGEAGEKVQDINYILISHYHPDHMGLIGELTEQGIRLVLVDTQVRSVHFSDAIFSREKHLRYHPIREDEAVRISCEESRTFLSGLGISGEIISTASHSEDSITIILDNGDCFAGDLEPIDYLEAYEENPALKADWDQVMSRHPKRIFYGHANTKIIRD